jgi:hypothetical protein
MIDGGRAERESAGDWTGDRLFSRKPGIYAAIVNMLRESLPVDAIARWLEVSDNTVRAVQEREQATIAEFRDAQVKRRRWAMNILIETIIRKAPQADLKDAVIAYGILDERQRLDAGAPTQRLEITGVPPEAEFARFLAARLANAHEVPVTGLAGGAAEQRAPAASPPQLPPIDPPNA